MLSCDVCDKRNDYGCPNPNNCRKLSIKKHDNEIYNHALDDVDNIITEQLDKSDNQMECQTLRWVLDVLSDLMK